ncbi:ABC transporter [Neobacillus drentensis]|uniref:ABC transporter n=1 Tax=Neobacillus drentensis TaxID=220684 RepID=UPI002FFFF1CC
MGHDHSSCSIFGIFLGFLTGVIWLLLAVNGVIFKFFVLLGGLGGLGHFLIILIALIGFLAFLIFGLCLFKKAWRKCKG